MTNGISLIDKRVNVSTHGPRVSVQAVICNILLFKFFHDAVPFVVSNWFMFLHDFMGHIDVGLSVVLRCAAFTIFHLGKFYWRRSRCRRL